MLMRIPGLRSGWYLVHELLWMFRDLPGLTRRSFERLYQAREDPWAYSRPAEQRRFHAEIEMIVAVRGSGRLGQVLEIGCAEGVFTEALAPHCGTLEAVDFAGAALARARKRRDWPHGVTFREFDLLQDSLQASFDVIVVVGVLDCISWPAAMCGARNKIVAALVPGGLLLIGQPIANEVINTAWWGRYLIRGAKWIDRHFSEHPELEIVARREVSGTLLTLFQRRPIPLATAREHSNDDD